MTRISLQRFDNMIQDMLRQCPNMAEADCDACSGNCEMFRALVYQGIEETPGIANTLRNMILDELRLRLCAIGKCPRCGELGAQEMIDILSNENYYIFDGDGSLVAIY